MRTVSSLDLLILAVATREPVTAYVMKAHADVSVAATIPALKRLHGARLLEMTEGPRNSRRYELSARGKMFLQRQIISLHRRVPADFESVLRVASVLQLLKPERVAGFLAAAVQTWRKRSPQFPGKLLDSSLAQSAHRWMKEVAATNRVKAEFETLKNLQKLLDR